MKRNLILAGTALVIALGATGAVVARDGGHGDRAAMMFERLDANGDGQITREEFDGAREARFTEADGNGDGLLSAEEMIAAAMARHSQEAVAERVGRMIERLDANGDGLLSPDEMPRERGGRMFERVDADGDGVITQEEAEDARARFADRHGHRKGGRHGRDG